MKETVIIYLGLIGLILSNGCLQFKAIEQQNEQIDFEEELRKVMFYRSELIQICGSLTNEARDEALDKMRQYSDALCDLAQMKRFGLKTEAYREKIEWLKSKEKEVKDLAAKYTSPEFLAKTETDALCRLYRAIMKTGDIHSSLRVRDEIHNEIRAELERRQVFTEDEWQLIDSRKIRIGSRKLVVIASWGKPKNINTTITRFGRREQWVYGDYRPYVYFDEEFVSAIQD